MRLHALGRMRVAQVLDRPLARARRPAASRVPSGGARPERRHRRARVAGRMPRGARRRRTPDRGRGRARGRLACARRRRHARSRAARSRSVPAAASARSRSSSSIGARRSRTGVAMSPRTAPSESGRALRAPTTTRAPTRGATARARTSAASTPTRSPPCRARPLGRRARGRMLDRRLHRAARAALRAARRRSTSPRARSRWPASASASVANVELAAPAFPRRYRPASGTDRLLGGPLLPRRRRARCKRSAGLASSSARRECRRGQLARQGIRGAAARRRGARTAGRRARRAGTRSTDVVRATGSTASTAMRAERAMIGGLRREPDPALRAVVVIPARDEALLIEACLLALARQREVGPESYEVIVVLDGCRDATGEVVRRSPRASPAAPAHGRADRRAGSRPRAPAGMDLACERLFGLGRGEG